MSNPVDNFAGASGNDPGEHPPGVSATEVFVCEYCLRAFSTRSGRGLHIKRAHEQQANEAINTERKKGRWTVEEMEVVAEAETDVEQSWQSTRRYRE